MKHLFSIMLVAFIATTSVFGMSTSKIRTHARFLSDRMAYELDLTVAQYEYCYEINYDFIQDINLIMNDVVIGYTDAIDRYYDYLDMRNEDLRYVLNSMQYARFRESDYFYYPVYSNGVSWNFRVYTIYSNTTFFYFDSPSIYKTYVGGHNRSHFSTGYYVDRINHGTIGISHRIELPNRNSREFSQVRKRDFGVNLRERNKPTYNNYSNGNQRNRTQDQRYRDMSGNRNSPAINQPATTPVPQQPVAQPNNNRQQPTRPSSASSRRTSNTSNVDTNTNKNAESTQPAPTTHSTSSRRSR